MVEIVHFFDAAIDAVHSHQEWIDFVEAIIGWAFAAVIVVCMVKAFTKTDTIH